MISFAEKESARELNALLFSEASKWSEKNTSESELLVPVAVIRETLDRKRVLELYFDSESLKDRKGGIVCVDLDAGKKVLAKINDLSSPQDHSEYWIVWPVVEPLNEK